MRQYSFLTFGEVLEKAKKDPDFKMIRAIWLDKNYIVADKLDLSEIQYLTVTTNFGMRVVGRMETPKLIISFLNENLGRTIKEWQPTSQDILSEDWLDYYEWQSE